VSREQDSFESLLERMVPGAGKSRSPAAPVRTVEIRRSAGSTLRSNVAVRMSTGSMPIVAPASDEGRERLGWASLQLAIATLVVYAVYCLTHTPDHLAALLPGHGVGGSLVFPVDHLAANSLIAVSLGLFLLARGRRIPAVRVEDAGLLYFVAAAVLISLFEQWQPRASTATHVGFPFVCVWIVLYPMVVPLRGGRFVLAALVAAASAPMALMLSVAIHGSGLPDATPLIWLVVMAALAAALAVYPTPFIHRLEAQAARARELGSYQLVAPLGEGSMGEVWKAHHRLLAREAAIKLIHPELLGGRNLATRQLAVQRFEREAEITASLRSPHTVQLYDFGITEDGSLYAVMELLEGTDLQTLVDEHGPLPPERVVHYLTQTCASLAEAHARGLIHRDVKPANLFACRYGLEVDLIKVLDFGLVRAPADGTATVDQLTAEGVTLGTPATMAPELIRGEADYDHRIDLYALGCVGHFLLTGRHVFEGDSAMKVLMGHLDQAPSAPSDIGVPVPSALERVLMTCLEKDPARRPADAGALAEALAAVPVGEPWTDGRARAWWDEHYPAGEDSGEVAAT
jgi:eukaryotic-like serine/threonine-protein kinase